MPDRDPSTISAVAPGAHGPTPSGVTFAKATIAGSWNVQGDGSQPSIVDAVRRRFDLDLPMVPNTTARNGALTALWLGPTSWLLVASDSSALTDFAAARDALNAAGGALFDLGASRVAWTVAGPQGVTVLAKGCPLDFHARAFAMGACMQSLFGHVNALFYRRDSASFTVMVARSFARDVWRALCTSAAQYGYTVLPARDF